ncbi:MAG: MBL fold metallo-hydrolase [Candidatus Heimdallarchaeaceae archaeon]
MHTADENIEKTKVILLGTGTPNALPNRYGPCIAILVNDIPYLFDFGSGLVRRMKEANIDVKSVKTVFLTHLHTDHTIGYPDLIFTTWVLGRQNPLDVYGPPGIAQMTEQIVKAYKEDIRARTEGLEPANTTGFRVNTHEVEPGMIFQDSNIRVEAFSVNHGLLEAYGYKIYTPDKVIVISGDTAPSDELINHSSDCDILIHEVYSAEGYRDLPHSWQEYHKSMHTSTHELGEIAKKVKPKLLILYHQLFWGKSEEELVEEIKTKYNGKVISGNDLDQF